MFTGQQAWKERQALRNSCGCGSSWFRPEPSSNPPASCYHPPPPSTVAASRNQSSPSRADPQSPAAESGACAVAGEGAVVHGADSPPGDCGAHNGRDAAATWAASPRQRGKSRIHGTSGHRRRRLSEDSLGKPPPPPTSPNRARKVTTGSMSKNLTQTFRTHTEGVFF